MSTILRLACLAAALVVLAAPAHAARVRSGDTVTIAPADTVRDDLYLSGQSVVVGGVVHGDVVAAGRTIRITGRVDGDVLAAGAAVTVGGDVGGSVRAAAGEVHITGRVGEDVVAAGGQVALEPGSSVGRDAVIGAGRATVGGEVGRGLTASAGTLELLDHAHVGGSVWYAGSEEMARAPGARIDGRVDWHRTGGRPTAGQRLLSGAIGFVRGWLGFLLFGIVLLLLARAFFARATGRLAGAPWPSLGTGFAVLVGLPVVALFALVLGLVIGGWWLGAFGLVAWCFGLTAGYVVSALCVGRGLGRRLGRGGAGVDAAPGYGALAVGLLVLGVLTLVPWLGVLVKVGAAVFGVGAMALALFARASAPAPATSASRPAA